MKNTEIKDSKVQDMKEETVSIEETVSTEQVASIEETTEQIQEQNNKLNSKYPFNITYIDEVTFTGERVKMQCITFESEGELHKYKIPYHFIIHEQKHYLYYWKENKDGEREITILSDYPIIPNKIAENIHTNEEKLELLMLKNNNWQKRIFSKNVLYSRPTELANSGVKVTSANARLFTKYIVDFEIINRNEISTMYTANNLGWTDNYKEFIPFMSSIQIEDTSKLEPYDSKGTLEEWVNSFSDYRKNNVFRFILSGAFSAPLLKLLNERPFVLYNYAPSRSGKTALLTVAMSAFGNPQKLFTSFDATRVGIEKSLEFNNCLPIAIDERQIADSQRLVEKIIFMIANQKGRIRGSKYGGLAPNVTFTNVALCTGEEPLAQTSTITGVASRCLEIEGSGFEDEKEAVKMYKITSNCYGTAGKYFIKKLIDEYSNTEYKELQEKLEELKKKLEEKSNSNVGSYITAVAVVTLADILVSKWLFNQESEELSMDMAVNILNNLSKAEDIDVTEKAYEFTKSYIVANHSRFAWYTTSICKLAPEDDVREKTILPIGVYDKGIYYIFLHELETFMNKNGFKFHKTVNEFAKRGYIIPALNKDGTIKSASVQKKYKNHNVRMYAFPIKEVVSPAMPDEIGEILPDSIRYDQIAGLKQQGLLVDAELFI